MIPSAKIDALLNAPPKNVSSKPKIPSEFIFKRLGSTPGRTIKEPSLKIAKKRRVLMILTLKSSMANMFRIVVTNFFIKIKGL